MQLFRAAALAALTFAISPIRVAAEDVTLTSRDGTVTVSGTLLGYDGEFYRVETRFGTLTVDGTGVTCEGPGCPDLEAFVAEFAFSGARDMAAVLLPALMEAFSARNGYRARRVVERDSRFTYILTDRETGRVAARIGIRAETTRQGFTDLISGETTLAIALREPTLDETARARIAGFEALEDARHRVIIGLDALAPVVSPANPVRSISLEDLARALAGDLTDWSELGGPGGAIRLHLHELGSAEESLLNKTLMAPTGLSTSLEATRHATAEGLSDAVSRDPAALGVTTFSHVDNARALPFRGTCGFSIRATPMTLKTEDYPLTAPLFLYLGSERLPLLAREFLGFMRSSAAAPVIRRAGYVDLDLEEIGLNAQGDRLANAIAAAGGEIGLEDLQRLTSVLRDATRLSVTFRFQDGAAELDAQSLSNVEQLADALESGAFDGDRLLFVGFSDGSGSADANLRLARERAEAVRSAVLDAAPFADRSRISVRVDAFGEALPMACDDSAWGRRINRRVEVWKLQR